MKQATDLENYLKELLDCVDAILRHFRSKNDWNNQSKSDVIQGYFRRRKANIIIPFEEVKHRGQFECHEQFVLNGYLNLARTVLERPGDSLAIFALRILHEIGFDKIDALFAQEISQDEKEEFKLMSCLSDLVGMAQDNYNRDFIALLNDERKMLNTKTRNLFEEVEAMLKIEGKINLALLKRVRRHINRHLGNLSAKISVSEIIKGKTDFEAINIHLSHLLHGNPIAINVAIDSKFSRQRVNWICVIVWSTSLNILIRTKCLIADRKLEVRIEELLRRADFMWVELQKHSAMSKG